MKDIKQYFANDKNIVDKETDTDLGNVKEENQEQEDIATNKHKHMRIWISSNGSSSRMYDIENKNDLIDKTSPFNSEINNGERTFQDGTPKPGALIKSSIKRLKKVFFILRITVDVTLLINRYS